MLLAGMDVSGEPKKDNYNYLAIVIGTEAKIDYLYSRTGPHSIHMSGLAEYEQKRIIKELVFDCKEIVSFCVKLDRDQIIKSVVGSGRIKRKKIPHRNILRTFNHIIMQGIRNDIDSFLLAHNETITKFSIECEGDCKPFADAGHFKSLLKNKAHAISDRVAWCNNKIGLIDTVQEINFAKDIPEKMIRTLT